MHRLRAAAITALAALVLSAAPAAAEEDETIIIGVVETVGGGAAIEITPSGDADVRATSAGLPAGPRSLARTGTLTDVLLLVALIALGLGTVMVRASGTSRHRNRPDVVGCGTENGALA